MSSWEELDARALCKWPLPKIPDDADKETRGRVLIVAGSREVAGAAQLAGVSALRAGAGKLVIATAASAAQNVAQSVPEARVIAMPENDTGSFEGRGIALLETTLANASAVLVGPGMLDARGNIALVRSILGKCRDRPVALDACAMEVVAEIGRFEQPVLMTPHAGEMAHLVSIDKDEVTREPQRIAMSAASRWNAVVALKGAVTWIAAPDGRCWRHAADLPGLATSGSGDVLAGLVAGFAARDAALEQACAWGVVVHALAGRALSRQMGPLGYLARELPGTVPRLMKSIRAREG